MASSTFDALLTGQAGKSVKSANLRVTDPVDPNSQDTPGFWDAFDASNRNARKSAVTPGSAPTVTGEAAGSPDSSHAVPDEDQLTETAIRASDASEFEGDMTAPSPKTDVALEPRKQGAGDVKAQEIDPAKMVPVPASHPLTSSSDGSANGIEAPVRAATQPVIAAASVPSANSTTHADRTLHLPTTSAPPDAVPAATTTALARQGMVENAAAPAHQSVRPSMAQNAAPNALPAATELRIPAPQNLRDVPRQGAGASEHSDAAQDAAGKLRTLGDVTSHRYAQIQNAEISLTSSQLGTPANGAQNVSAGDPNTVVLPGRNGDIPTTIPTQSNGVAPTSEAQVVKTAAGGMNALPVPNPTRTNGRQDAQTKIDTRESAPSPVRDGAHSLTTGAPLASSAVTFARTSSAVEQPTAVVQTQGVTFALLNADALQMENPGGDEGVLPPSSSLRFTAEPAIQQQIPQSLGQFGRADHARQMMVQIVQNGVPQNGDVVSIRLTPEELGTVQYRLSQAETGAVLVVSADRQETLDLLRRNAESLLQEFADLGLDAGSLSFEDGMFDQEEPKSDDTGTASAMPQDTAHTNPAAQRVMTHGGVDIRL